VSPGDAPETAAPGDAPEAAAPDGAPEVMARAPEAVASARALVAARAKEGRHHVAASVITTTGRLHTAINVDSVLGRAAVCAEAVAIGMACAAEPEAEIAFSVAVNRRSVVIAACGLCRELLLDYGARSLVAIPDRRADGSVPEGAADYRVVSLADLVPEPYKQGFRGV
jgi:cytidine deaminase